MPDFCFPEGKKRVTKRKKKSSSTRAAKKQCVETNGTTAAVPTDANKNSPAPASNETAKVDLTSDQQATNLADMQMSSPPSANSTPNNGSSTPTQDKPPVKPVSLPKEPIMNEIEPVNDYWGNTDASAMKKPIKVSLVSFTGKSESE